MTNLLPFSINKNKFNFDENLDEKKDYPKKHSDGLGITTIPIDYLKLIAIIVLFAGSLMMYNYNPSSTTTIHYANNNQFQSNASLNNGNDQPEDNPYGFHPFYQVHKRVQYKNPAINVCDNIDPSKTLLLAILSRASNVHIREAIRQTWGAVRVYHDIEIRIIFLVGVDDGMLKQIEIEQIIYHDVIQVNLPENYPVVSYKELAALCWSKYYCPDIQFLFKADEDIHLNTPLLASIVADFMRNETLPQAPVMYGWFRHKSRVDRTGRYLVTEEEYPGFYYPPYTFGIGYLMTRAGRDNLCVSAQRPHPVTRVGDAYITGILRDHAMVEHARFGDIHYIYSYTLNGKRCPDYFTYDRKLLVCMSSLHSGITDVADEYVHVWNAVYKDRDDQQEEEEE